MILNLTCNHCNQKTLLLNSINETKILCANGDCHKHSDVNQTEKITEYIKFLETENAWLTKKVINLSENILTNKELLNTKHGKRLIELNNIDQIQWALLN